MCCQNNQDKIVQPLGFCAHNILCWNVTRSLRFIILNGKLKRKKKQKKQHACMSHLMQYYIIIWGLDLHTYNSIIYRIQWRWRCFFKAIINAAWCGNTPAPEKGSRENMSCPTCYSAFLNRFPTSNINKPFVCFFFAQLCSSHDVFLRSAPLWSHTAYLWG